MHQTASAQGTAQYTGGVLTINPKQMGYNVNSVRSGPDFRINEYHNTINRLRPGNLRYPAGTIANYWDWRTGTIIQNITSGPRPYLTSDIPYTIADFSKALPKGTEVVYVVNMVRPTPWTGIAWNADPTILRSVATLNKQIDDMLAAIEEFANKGVIVTKLELGNEFYQGALGDAEGASGVYTGDVNLYISHANLIAKAVHTKYPNMQIAVLGDSVDEADNATYTSGISPWTDAIYTAISNGTLHYINAVTFHWYTGPGVSILNSDNKAMESLSRPFGKARHIKTTDFNKNRLGLDLWITEYANYSPAGTSNNPNNPGNGGAIQGTWVNGMFMASQTLQYTMMGSKVSLLNVHGLLNNHIQWAMAEDESTVTGNGVAMALTGRAMNGRNKAQEVKFNNIVNPTFGPNADPSLYAVKFWNSGSGALIVLNNTNQARTGVDISAVFGGTANKRLTCYNDPAPRLLNIADADTNRVNENSGLTYTYNDNVGNTVSFPPFSITVIEQEKENLIKNGSFESGSGEWSNINFVQNGKKNAYTGSRSMLLNTTTQGFKGATQKVPVTANKQYTIEMMIRTDLSAGTGRFMLKYLNASNAQIGSTVVSDNTSGFQTYKSISKTFTTPAGTVNLEVTIQNNNGLGNVWFDDVTLYAGQMTTLAAIGKNSSAEITLLPDGETNSALVIYPNPAQDKIFVNLKNLGETQVKVSIYNLQGQMIKRLNFSGKELIQADIQELKTGVYILSVSDAITNKLIGESKFSKN